MISTEFHTYIRFLKLILRNSKHKKEKQLKLWIESGRPNPPPHVVKQKIITEYAKEYKIETLVESGTFCGDMVYSQKNNFKKIISIELSPTLFYQTKKTLRSIKNVELFLGDSSKILKILFEKGIVKEPCIFWLDGHYSGGETALGDKETPVLEELAIILDSQFKNIILVDDARCFNGTNDYPSLAELQKFILKRNFNYSFSVKDDIIRLSPNN